MRYLFNIFLILFLSVSSVQAFEGGDNSHKDSSADPSTVVCLHTEFLPVYEMKTTDGEFQSQEQPVDKSSKLKTNNYKSSEELKFSSRLNNLLSRELVRQAMIVTLVDEIGVAVCDQTLQDSIPEKASLVHLAVLSRRTFNGYWAVRLYGFSPDDQEHNTHGLWEQKPIWEKVYKYRSVPSKRFETATPVFELASRSDFVEALELAGIGRAAPSNKIKSAQNDPDSNDLTDWNQRLLTVDFVAQYGVLREIHQTIRSHGQTPELLGLLSRGYANLGLMTCRQMSPATEVFFARSLLYAQRMAAVSNQSDFAIWHIANAFGLVGLQRVALQIVEKIDQS